MILTRLVVENYGLFAGCNEFDLNPRVKYRKRRPIVLFGGKNGAGKTTILGAIRLLLYGRASLGSKLSKADYDAALLARVHRNKHEDTRASYSKIGLEFEHVVGGEKHLYFVERSWMVRRADGIEEFFRVLKDGQPLDDIGPEHWESFIADIVPERLSQLFFFDGEKIKGIAEDISSNAAIADAIRSLLGLDAVLALKSDLQVYRNRLLKKANPEAFDKELAGIRAELQDSAKQIEANEEMRAALRTQIDGIRCGIQSLESQLEERGGSFADKRGSNQRRADELEVEIAAAQQAIRECCEGALPFALCPSASGTLVAQIDGESSLRDREIGIQHVDRIQSFLGTMLAESGLNGGSEKVGKFINKNLEEYKRKLSHGSTVRLVHGLSAREADRIRDILTSDVDEEVDKILSRLGHLEKETRELQEVSRDLEKAPDKNELKELFDVVGSRNQELGTLQEQEAKLAEERTRLDTKFANLRREEDRLTAKISVGLNDAAKLDQIRRLGPALDAYRDRLTQAKVSALQAEVTECFNRLARKTDFVKGILIDPQTFQVQVLDQQGRAIPKEDLSSGEKQIFAIAMLWGLARTSGRPLPVVVDTPLGRLDSDHRANLIHNYFPHAGHQVILLSTDTEVDQPLFQALSPHVSHCYHLNYDHKDGRTISSEEYFWRA